MNMSLLRKKKMEYKTRINFFYRAEEIEEEFVLTKFYIGAPNFHLPFFQHMIYLLNYLFRTSY
jgi:hypothetical protein